MIHVRRNEWSCSSPFSSTGVQALTANEKFVTQVYQDFLLRDPSSAELAWGAAALGSQTRSAYVGSVLYAAPFRELWINYSYTRYGGRLPTSTEMSTASSALQTSGDYLAVELDLLASTDYFNRADATNGGYVDALYENLLWREADASSYDFWVNELDTAARTRRQVASWIIRSTESAGIRVAGIPGEAACLTIILGQVDDLSSESYCLILDRMADSSGATYWAGQLAATAQLPSLWISLASSTEY